MCAANVEAFTSWSTTLTNNQPVAGDSADIISDLTKIQAEVRKYVATKGADIASATTTDLATATGNYVHITGTTTITGLGTVSAGVRFLLVFDGILTFTHNATSLILPTGANITTAAGDRCEVVSLGSGNWRCLWYQRAAGYASLALEQTWTAQQTPMNGTLTDGATIDWNCDSNGQSVSVTLEGNRTLAEATNVNEHACYILRVTQDGTGGRTLAWNAAYKFAGGVDPVLSTAAAAVDIFTFVGGASNVMYCIGQAKGLA